MPLGDPGVQLKPRWALLATRQGLALRDRVREGRGPDRPLSSERDAVTPLNNHGSG